MSWLFLFLSLSAAQAATLLVQAPDSSVLDYRAMLKAHTDYISPTEQYLNSHPDRALREKLLGAFAEAQKSFLANSNAEAKAHFVELLALLPQDDWEKSDREIFLHAYLRLAQMETDNSARERWLGLSLLLGDAAADANLFPPPLLAEREALRARLPKLQGIKKFFARGWSEVLINGQRCNLKNCADWPAYSGPVRFTVLSDQWLAKSVVINLVEIDGFAPVTAPLAEGKCDDEHFHASLDRYTNKKIFWNLDCSKPTAAKNLNLNPVSIPGLEVATPYPTSKSIPFYKKTWFWTAVGAAVIVGVAASMQKHETKEPTTSYGY